MPLNKGYKIGQKMQVKFEKNLEKMRNAAASVISAPSRAVSKIKKTKADMKYGAALWKQGYGEYHDSALKVAKKGKNQPKRK